MSATRIPAAMDNTSGWRCAKTSARRLGSRRHILRFHRHHDDVGARGGFAVVGSHEHAEFVGKLDAARLYGFSDGDVSR